LSAWTGWEAPDPAFWVPRGYAVVNADLRGGGASEGTAALFSDQEAEDYYELIEWAGGQPWSSGRVGLAGVSYLAISQYKVAALRPPHLAAICPWEGFTDLYRDFARPGGVLESGFSSIWSTLTRKKARVAGNLRRELARRPERDEWYAVLTPRLEQIEVPMLVCGSFSDHSLQTRGSFEAFRRGELLRLDIRGTWQHPRNPVTGQPPFRYAASPKGTCILHGGGEHAARLLLGLRPLQCVLPPSPTLGPNA
jgi:predicted acyl esterase